KSSKDEELVEDDREKVNESDSDDVISESEKQLVKTNGSSDGQPKKRGRKPKNPSEPKPSTSQGGKKRGRPPKQASADGETASPPKQAKPSGTGKPRGRPKKDAGDNSVAAAKPVAN